MRLNTEPVEPPRKPCIRDYAELKATLLPDSLVMLVPIDELERRANEINATQPRFREETPIVVATERKRRSLLSGLLQLSVTSFKTAQSNG
jgi:hypothetical protein